MNSNEKQEYLVVLNALKDQSANNYICDSRLYEAALDEAIKAIDKPDDSQRYIKEFDDIKALVNRFDALTLMERKANGEVDGLIPSEKVSREYFYMYFIMSLKEIGDIRDNYKDEKDALDRSIMIIKHALQVLCMYTCGKSMCAYCDMKDDCIVNAVCGFQKETKNH